MGRHSYINSNIEFLKITTELEKENYNELIKYCRENCYSLKEVFNWALSDYFKNMKK